MTITIVETVAVASGDDDVYRGAGRAIVAIVALQLLSDDGRDRRRSIDLAAGWTDALLRRASRRSRVEAMLAARTQTGTLRLRPRIRRGAADDRRAAALGRAGPAAAARASTKATDGAVRWSPTSPMIRVLVVSGSDDGYGELYAAMTLALAIEHGATRRSGAHDPVPGRRSARRSRSIGDGQSRNRCCAMAWRPWRRRDAVPPVVGAGGWTAWIID